ncbi:MAG: response regulator, partial [Magnetococcales bacterium]|nr:response regulator [Magnetococcales bacterium]
LEQMQVTVVLAENGQQAIDRVFQESLDGVLMDVHMPVMDGLTATRRIREEPRFAHLPILAMTANAMFGDRQACLEAGMQDHIAKPVDPDALYAALLRWIKPAAPKVSEPPARRACNEGNGPLMPEIAGLDSRAGVVRMGGNIRGYLKLLAKFRANQGEAATAIRTAMANQDLATAERLAHTLKGVAGVIGADLLAKRAAALEQAARQRAIAAEIEPLLQEAAEELARLCAAVEKALPVADAPGSLLSSGEREDVERRNQLLKTAAHQLAFFDAAVEQTLLELRQCNLSQSTLAWLGRMEQQVGQYDFDEAAALLKQCAESLELPWDGMVG